MTDYDTSEKQFDEALEQATADDILNLREESYGDFNTFSEKLLRMYNVWKGSRKVETPSDVAMFMVFLKLARESYKHKIDNIVDARGYLRLYEKEVRRVYSDMANLIDCQKQVIQSERPRYNPFENIKLKDFPTTASDRRSYNNE